MRHLIWIAILGLQPAVAWGQQKSSVQDSDAYTIPGTILDPSGAVIPGARLVLTKEDGSSVAEGVSDDKGTFRFDKVNPGKYRVAVEAAGFRGTKTDVTAGPRSRAEIRVTMPIDTRTESVTMAGDSAPVVNTEISGNQSSVTLDRSTLDRVPVFDQDYIATISRFLDSTGTGTNGVDLIVNGVAPNGPENAVQSPI